MRIIIQEIRRFCRPALLFLIAVLALCWYYIYESNCHMYLENDMGMHYRIAREYAARFGPSLDARELAEVRKDAAAADVRRDQLIAQEIGEYGIHNLEEYEDYDEKYEDIFTSEEDSEVRKSALTEWGQEEYDRRQEMYEKISQLFWEGPVLSAVFEAQDIRFYLNEDDSIRVETEAFRRNRDDEEWFFGDGTAEEKDHLAEILDKGEIAIGLQSLSLVGNFRENAKNWGLLLFLCCALLIAPLPVKNKIRGISPLQYTSRQGRKILSRQLAAAFIAGVSLSLLLIAAFCLFYFQQGGEFMACPLNAACTSELLWWDLTFRQYIVGYWAKTIFFLIGEILVEFWISYHSKNYITAIAASIPAVAVFYQLCNRIDELPHMFSGFPKYSFPAAVLVPLAAAVAAAVLFMRRARKADYLWN